MTTFISEIIAITKVEGTATIFTIDFPVLGFTSSKICMFYNE